MNNSHGGWYGDEKKPKTIHVCVDNNGTKHFSDFGCPVANDKIKEDYYIREITKDAVGFEKIDIQREREERDRKIREREYKSDYSTMNNSYRNTDSISNSYSNHRTAIESMKRTEKTCGRFERHSTSSIIRGVNQLMKTGNVSKQVALALIATEDCL